MDLWFRTWNAIQYFSLLESEISFLIIEGKWFSLFYCWVFSWILFFCCWLIFFRELWQVKAKYLYCQVQCGQDQPGGRWGRLFLGGQGCHGTIIRMSHIYLVWRDRMWGCLLILGPVDLVIVWCLQCCLAWLNGVYTLGTEGLGLLCGISFQSHILANFWLSWWLK